jgi:hypothetical protein
VEGVPREVADSPLGLLMDSPLTPCEALLNPGDCLLLYNYRACAGDSHTRPFDDRDVRSALREACAAEPERVSERLGAVVASHPLVVAGLVRLA